MEKNWKEASSDFWALLLLMGYVNFGSASFWMSSTIPYFHLWIMELPRTFEETYSLQMRQKWFLKTWEAWDFCLNNVSLHTNPAPEVYNKYCIPLLSFYVQKKRFVFRNAWGIPDSPVAGNQCSWNSKCKSTTTLVKSSKCLVQIFSSIIVRYLQIFPVLHSTWYHRPSFAVSSKHLKTNNPVQSFNHNSKNL